MKWEYRILRGSYEDEDELNGIGSNGWELYAINYDEIEEEDVFYFKRQIKGRIKG